MRDFGFQHFSVTMLLFRFRMKIVVFASLSRALDNLQDVSPVHEVRHNHMVRSQEDQDRMEQREKLRRRRGKKKSYSMARPLPSDLA
jgi:hypothetical protein